MNQKIFAICRTFINFFDFLFLIKMTEPDHIKNIELTMNSDYSSMSTKESQIDPSSQRFPTCIVWTPLPLIT